MSKDKKCIKALFHICLLQQEALEGLLSGQDLSPIQEELDQLGEILYPKEKENDIQ